MTYKKAIWVTDKKVLTRFNHWKLDHGEKPDIALTELLDIAERNTLGNS
jgi:hypothetical protein